MVQGNGFCSHMSSRVGSMAQQNAYGALDPVGYILCIVYVMSILTVLSKLVLAKLSCRKSSLK